MKGSCYGDIEGAEVRQEVFAGRSCVGIMEGRDVFCLPRVRCYEFLTFGLLCGRDVSPESEKAEC